MEELILAESLGGALYPKETKLMQPHANTDRITDGIKKGNPIKEALLDGGRRYGFIPYYNGFRDLIEPNEAVEDPVYLGPPGIARKYYRQSTDRLQRLFEKTQGVIPYIGRNIRKIVIGKLPTQWGLFIRKVGDGYYEIRPRIVGKIYGMFDKTTKTLYMDRTNFPEIHDPEKDLLKRSGFPVNRGERVMTEEVFHSVQDTAGILDKYPRDVVEGEAAVVSDAVAGNIGSYPQEKRKYLREYGSKMLTDFGEKMRKLRHYFDFPSTRVVTQN